MYERERERESARPFIHTMLLVTVTGVIAAGVTTEQLLEITAALEATTPVMFTPVCEDTYMRTYVSGVDRAVVHHNNHSTHGAEDVGYARASRVATQHRAAADPRRAGVDVSAHTRGEVTLKGTSLHNGRNASSRINSTAV